MAYAIICAQCGQHVVEDGHCNDQTTITMIHEQQAKESSKPSRKRSRTRDGQPNSVDLVNSSTKSLSQLSISRQEQRTAGGEKEEVKKLKNSMREKMSSSFSNNDNDNNTNDRSELRNEDNNCTLYELPKYLRMPRKLLVHSLRLELNSNRRLKWNKQERRFLFTRLQLFDRQFYLDQIRYLYQFYFDQGLKYQTWPVSF